MNRDEQAKAAVILAMMERGWPTSDPTPALIEGMALACRDVRAAAVAEAAREFYTGSSALERDHHWPPTGAELAARAAVWERAMRAREAPATKLHTGIMDIDFGHGRIDMRGLTAEEQDRVISAHGETPDGRSMAYLSLEEIRKVLAGDLLAPPVPPVPRVVPKVQRMTDA